MGAVLAKPDHFVLKIWIFWANFGRILILLHPLQKISQSGKCLTWLLCLLRLITLAWKFGSFVQTFQNFNPS